MTKSDLSRRLFKQFPEISLPEAKKILDFFLAAMKEGLSSGDTVELRDFGVLRVRDKKRRKARNPRTGEKVDVPAKKAVYFKQSRILKGKLNRGNG